MSITIDEAQEFIINHVREWKQGETILAKANYDIHLNTTVDVYINNHQTTISYPFNNQTPSKYIFRPVFADALWDLCRKGILRLGTNSNPNFSCSTTIEDPGFSMTEFGKEWLSKRKNDALLPADPNKFTMLFSNFQSSYGASYFRRAKEAVSSLQLGNFLACCVMSGAAAESILLSAAFASNKKMKF